MSVKIRKSATVFDLFSAHDHTRAQISFMINCAQAHTSFPDSDIRNPGKTIDVSVGHVFLSSAYWVDISPGLFVTILKKNLSAWGD